MTGNAAVPADPLVLALVACIRQAHARRANTLRQPGADRPSGRAALRPRVIPDETAGVACHDAERPTGVTGRVVVREA